jgi:hypothetical protein
MVEMLEELPPQGKNRGKRVRCLCECGRGFEARKSNVLSGRTTSCGCKRTGRPKKKVTTETLVTVPKNIATIRKAAPVIKKLPLAINPIDEEYDKCENLIQKVMDRWDKTKEEIAESIGLRVYQLDNLSHEELHDVLERAGAL